MKKIWFLNLTRLYFGISGISSCFSFFFFFWIFLFFLYKKKLNCVSLWKKSNLLNASSSQGGDFGRSRVPRRRGQSRQSHLYRPVQSRTSRVRLLASSRSSKKKKTKQNNSFFFLVYTFNHHQEKQKTFDLWRHKIKIVNFSNFVSNFSRYVDIFLLG